MIRRALYLTPWPSFKVARAALLFSNEHSFETILFIAQSRGKCIIIKPPRWMPFTLRIAPVGGTESTALTLTLTITSLCASGALSSWASPATTGLTVGVLFFMPWQHHCSATHAAAEFKATFQELMVPHKQTARYNIWDACDALILSVNKHPSGARDSAPGLTMVQSAANRLRVRRCVLTRRVKSRDHGCQSP
jgi:hypothetical protein